MPPPPDVARGCVDATGILMEAPSHRAEITWAGGWVSNWANQGQVWGDASQRTHRAAWGASPRWGGVWGVGQVPQVLGAGAFPLRPWEPHAEASAGPHFVP